MVNSVINKIVNLTIKKSQDFGFIFPKTLNYLAFQSFDFDTPNQLPNCRSLSSNIGTIFPSFVGPTFNTILPPQLKLAKHD